MENLLRVVHRIAYSLPDVVGNTVLHATRFGSVVSFWFWLGWMIDTRKHRTQDTTSARQFLSTSGIYMILFAFCILEVWLSWRSLDVIAYAIARENTCPLKIWDFDKAVGAVWFLAGGVYFGKKALSLLKARSMHTQRV